MAAAHHGTKARKVGRVLGLIFLLNLLDAGFTMILVQTGLASEANPLLRRLAHEEWALFLLVKTVLVGLGLWVLWRFRTNRVTLAGMPVLLAIYLGVVLYHSGIMVGIALTTF
jgi:Ca2+/Na+ antiporter